jgi:hypothetical protein
VAVPLTTLKVLSLCVVCLTQLVGAVDCLNIIKDPGAIKSGILLQPVKVVEPRIAIFFKYL